MTISGRGLSITDDSGGLQHNYTAVVAPTANDDSSAGYSVGSQWIDTVGDQWYVCTDSSVGAAAWSTTNPGGTTALLVSYDNSTSGLVATNVQDATDEIEARVDILEGKGSFTTYTNPAINTISISDVDTYRGAVITLSSSGNSQTLPTPTVTTTFHSFTVINNDTSTYSIDIIGASTITVDPGKRIEFVWDQTSWIPSDAEGLWYKSGSSLSPQTSGDSIDIPGSGELLLVGTQTNLATPRVTLVTRNSGYASPSNVGSNSDGDKWVFWNTAGVYKGSIGFNAREMWFQSTDVGVTDNRFKWFGGSSGVPVEHMSLGDVSGLIFNTSRTDIDFEIRRQTSGEAYKYDFGLETHTWVGSTFTKNSLINKIGSESLADDAEIILVTGVAGFGFVQIGDNQEWAQFSFSSDGTVNLIQNSTNVVNTDTDLYLCIYDAGSGIAIKNRLGSSLTIRYDLKYS